MRHFWQQLTLALLGVGIAAHVISGTARAEPRSPSTDSPGSELAIEFIAPGSGATTFDFRTDGACIAVARGTTVSLWDSHAGRPHRISIEHAHPVLQVRFSPDGKWILTKTAAAIHFWDATTGQAARPDLKFDVSGVRIAAFTSDGARVLLVRQYDFAELRDFTRVTPLAPPLRVGVLPRTKPTVGLQTAVLSADGKKVVTCSSDGLARVWDAATGAAVGPPLAHEGIAGALSPPAITTDGTRMLTLRRAGGDYAGIVWDTAKGQELSRLGKHPHGNSVVSAAISPDGKRVATGGRSDGLGRVWNAETGRPVTPWLRHAGAEVWRVAFSADGLKLLSVDENVAEIRVWDAETGEQIHSTNANAAAFSPDGRRLLTTHADGMIRIWDLDKLELDVPRAQDDIDQQ